MRVLVAACAALLVGSCVTGYSREAPAGAWPAGELSGPPTLFVGWRVKM